MSFVYVRSPGHDQAEETSRLEEFFVYAVDKCINSLDRDILASVSEQGKKKGKKSSPFLCKRDDHRSAMWSAQ